MGAIMQAAAAVNKKIRIDFHPLAIKGPFAVEKQDGGAKHRYFEGVTSGPALDGHGERMTERCIDSFRRQAGCPSSASRSRGTGTPHTCCTS